MKFCRAKIRNIEATEEAKLKLLWDRHRKKDGPSQFVPTNMAVNFVQHNRCMNFLILLIKLIIAERSKFVLNLVNKINYRNSLYAILVNIEDPDFQKSRQDSDKKKCVTKEDIRGKRNNNGEKATDDYHYERFKKQFRRF